MTSVLNLLLVGCAVSPLIGVVGSYLASYRENRKAGFWTVRLAFVSGSICAGILAVLLSQRSSDFNAEIRSPLWTWISFSVSPSPSISFGLIATAGRAALLCLSGILALFAIKKANSKSTSRFSENDVMAVCVLYAAGVFFVLASTRAQAFLGWCVISSIAGLLRWRSGSHRNEVNSVNASSPYRRLGATAELLEWFWIEFLWKPVVEQLPNWLAEQAEDFRSSYDSLQILATVLGTFAILLTWLL